MAYQRAPNISPHKDESTHWISPMSSMTFDEPADEPRRMSSFSFNLAHPDTVGDYGAHALQHDIADSQASTAVGERASVDNCGQDLGTSIQRSISRDNPLGLSLSHQSSQFSIRRVPVPKRVDPVESQPAAPSVENSYIQSGMASPRDTLIGEPSPRRMSLWGRLRSFQTKSLYRKESASKPLTTHMETISGTDQSSTTEGRYDSGNYPGQQDSRDDCGDDYKPCPTRKDIQSSSRHWLTKVVVGASLYSTVGSCLWFLVAIIQPRWGRSISSSMGLGPSTATVLAAWLSKTIELTFVTTFITFLGQVLTRKAIARASGGTTLAEMSMRSWVIQPGSLMTHFGMLRYAGFSVLGILSLLATLVAAFYTTASDAMVAPKLKYGNWEHKLLSGYVRSSYANIDFVKQSCPALLTYQDKENAADSCTGVMVSGESYRTLQGFMSVWDGINTNGSDLVTDFKSRPAAVASLNGNTTLVGAWIETQHGDVKAQYQRTGRIINNVTLAMPHPGVAAAAISSLNGILQPDDLSGVGEYAIKAGVVSPAVNVLCVNMLPDELAPLVYTEWPYANNSKTGVKNQTIGWENWASEVPEPSYSDGSPNWLNSTIVDDIFRWGPAYKRRPPVFQLFPADYNTLVNSSVVNSDAIYLMGKKPQFQNYTLCELRSWVSPSCSTQFNISGIAGSKMAAHCEDPDDVDSYRRSFDGEQEWGIPVADWKWLADQWRTAADLNGGQRNNNPANARILTQLILGEPNLPTYLPSMAEALAVFASSTLVLGSVGTPFHHYWEFTKPGNILGPPGTIQHFNASVITQEYTSGHVYAWQGVFYLVLATMFGLNLVCFVYLILHARLVTDFTEAHNLFSLALNSRPNELLKGTCGGGPEGHDLAIPWRVAHDSDANHFFIEQAYAVPSATDGDGLNTATGKARSRFAGQSYGRLANGRSWV